jgi:hypothetical protein
LDRKNTEIEELKANYRAKAKELEDTITKLERKSMIKYKLLSYFLDFGCKTGAIVAMIIW